MPPVRRTRSSAADDTQYEYQQRLHATYKELRTEGDRIALELGGRYDRMLSLITGGALVGSLTFIEKIAPDPVAGTRWVAFSAWVLLGSSIISCLIAIAQSQKAQQKKIENMDSEILQRLYPNNPSYQDLDFVSNPYVRSVQWANLLSLTTGILGIACLILFAFLNFPNRKSNEPKTTPAPPAITTPAAFTAPEGATAPDPGNLCAEHQPGCPTPTSEKAELIMPPPKDPPPPPPKPMRETRGSYIPTQNQVPPPPPPVTTTEPAAPNQKEKQP